MKSISATSYNLYTQCPLQWKLKYVVRLLEPDNVNFIIGSAYHKALELYYQGKDRSYIADEMKKTLLKNKTKDEIERFGIVRTMFDLYINNPIDIKETISTEYNFYYDIQNVLQSKNKIGLIGYIDRLTPEAVIDYKTSSKDFTIEDTNSNIQTDIYSYIFWKEKGFFPKIIYHVMNKKRLKDDTYKPQTIEVVRTEEHMKILEGKLKEFYDNVIAERFDCNCNSYCWCSWREYCNH